MATLTIAVPGQVITPAQWAPAPAARLAARLLALHSPHEIAEAITVLIDVLDLLGGDSDLEDNDAAEDDDPAEQDDPAEEDDPQGACDEDEVSMRPKGLKSGRSARIHIGPGCELPEEGL